MALENGPSLLQSIDRRLEAIDGKLDEHIQSGIEVRMNHASRIGTLETLHINETAKQRGRVGRIRDALFEGVKLIMAGIATLLLAKLTGGL